METGRLIEMLVAEVEPVKTLAPPLRRAARWACASGLYVALLVLVVPPGVDPAARIQDITFLIEQGAALLTGAAAAFAALASTIPGHRRETMWLPLGPAAIWVAVVIARACAGAAPSLGTLQADWHCVPATVAGAALPAALIALLLRRGVALTPGLTGVQGALAAASVGNVGICFFRLHASNLAVLTWHLGTVGALMLLGGLVSARFFEWPAGRGATAWRAGR
jgi:hypothetical protein